MDPEDQFRLPRTVDPRRYQLRLEPDLEAATFLGTAAIDVEVHEPVTEIVCNAAELTVTDATVSPGTATPADPGAASPATPADPGAARTAEVHLDPEEERLHLILPTPLNAGPATITCRFQGVLNDKLRGFYRSTFTGPDGTERVIATTQMEATDARRAFPCWDEPDRKATFEVTLVVPEDMAAYSNSPAINDAPTADGRRAVTFAPTMAMSTYLVAFIVGPLEATEPTEVDGVLVRVVHVPGKGRLSAFALEVAAHALRFFTDYFNIPYPADKLDLVAIPDFAFGAMENLGCVTFRESALLVDPEHAARTELERVADVVSHEIAHMWFGDLVTMGWWNGIWLNEAFATFMEVLCVDAFRPAWERWVSFGMEREMALAVDGLHSTRPVEYPVGRPEEADGMFDILTYQKGGSLLRMLERYMGADAFRDGVRTYLRTHAYGNTETTDLWDALESSSGEPVRTVMDSWIFQGGHPLVHLDEDGTLSQHPFTFTPEPPSEIAGTATGVTGTSSATSAIGGPWRVPVLVRLLDGGSELTRVLLDNQPVNLTGDRLPAGASAAGAAVGGGRGDRLPAGAADSVARGDRLVNAGGWGFYRAGYASARLDRLAQQLGALTTLERANLLADTWALALADQAPVTDFLRLAWSLGDGLDPADWTVVVGALGLLDRIVPDADRPRLAAAVRALLGPPAARLGWEGRAGEPERTPTLRGMLLRALGTIGADAAVREEAAARWDRARDRAEPAALDPNVAAAVLDSVATACRSADFDAFWERHRQAQTPQEELRYLYALAAFPDEGLAVRAMDLAATEVRTQNAPLLINLLLTNRVGGPAVWQQVRARWDDLLARFPNNTIDRMLGGLRGLCGHPAAAEDALAFLAEHPVPSGSRSVAQTAERLRVQLAFAARTSRQVGVLADEVVQAAGG